MADTAGRRRTGLALGLVCLLFLAACVQVGSLGRDSAPAPTATVTPSLSSAQPQVSLLLDARGTAATLVRLTIESVELSDGSQWQPLLRQPASITSSQAASGLLLDRAQVATGRYSRLRCRLGSAVMERDGQTTTLIPAVQAVEISLSPDLDLRSGDSFSLFLHWDVAASLAKAPSFLPTFASGVQQPGLTRGLAFVSCPEINTIYLVRVDQNRVWASWGVSGRPTSLRAVPERNLLYVLAEEQARIKVLELSTGQLRDQIQLPTAVEPFFMTIDAAARYAYLLDARTDSILRVSLESGAQAGQVRMGEPMDYALLMEDQGRLAVSAARSNKVFLLDATTLQVQRTLATSAPPQGLAAGEMGLYLAEGRGNAVSLHNLNTGATLRQPVGLGPSRVLLHDRTLFVANAQSGTVAFLQPEQLTVRKEVAIGNRPAEMAVSAQRNWLYVSDGTSAVAVLDLTGQRQKGRIELLARPNDIEVIP